MPIPFIIPLNKLDYYSSEQLGNLALQWRSLAKNKIPIPNTYCIPIATLEQIARANHLKTKISNISSLMGDQEDLDLNNRVLAKIKEIIASQHLPESLNNQLLKFFDENFGKNFAKVSTSLVDQETEANLEQENIQGEANLIDSIFKVWAEAVSLENVINKQFIPAAILIQAQWQDEVSGLAHTADPLTGEKNIIIHSLQGIYDPQLAKQADIFKVEPYNFQIKHNTITTQNQLAARRSDQLKIYSSHKANINQSSLSNSQVTKLAKLVQQIKRLSLKQLTIHWAIYGGKIIIEKVKQLNFAPSKNENLGELVGLGQALIGGFVSGHIQIIKDDKDVKNFKLGSIAIVNKLHKDNLAIIPKAKALICEQAITNPSYIERLKAYNTASIAKAKIAKQKLSTYPEIIVNASAGKIYLPKSIVKHVNKKTTFHSSTKILSIPVNYLPDSSNSDSLLIDLNNLVLRYGVHPIYLARSKKRVLFQKYVVKEISQLLENRHDLKTLYWRLLSLNTQELQQLDLGEGLEITETNPSLGFRGTLRSLSQLELLNFELEIYSYVKEKLNLKIPIILPFVRSVGELKLCQAHIKKTLPQKVKIIMELSTPENIINLSSYLKQHLDGVYVKTQNILALSQGIDIDNNDIYPLYKFDYDLALHYLKKIVPNFSQISQSIVEIPHLNHQLIKYLLKHKLNTLAIQSRFASHAKQCIIDMEVLCQQSKP